jgi:hypothetical protein
MSRATPRWPVRQRIAAAVLGALLLHTGAAQADAESEARVYPLQAFFHNDRADSKLHPAFLSLVAAYTPAKLGEFLHKEMHKAFAGHTGALDRHSMCRTFVASVHVGRATAYRVDKGNGNAEVVATVGASLYFTNVQTGEILKTVTETVVSRAVVANAQPQDVVARQQFDRALRELMKTLVERGAKEFKPTALDVKITDLPGDLLVLDTGYRRGVQLGDLLSDDASQLIRVVYTAADYAVAKRELANQLQPGAVFRKYLSQAADGRVRPRTVIYVESQPADYGREYLAQMFAELLGDKAPLSIVAVSTSFAQLLDTVTQQAALNTDDTSNRTPPSLVVRLRVADPIVYEARTNLDFQRLRHYETLAFADVLDTQGRILFSAMGKDTIDDTVANLIGVGMQERREVSVKNALMHLAQKFATLTEPRLDRAEIVADASGAPAVVGTGKVYAPEQSGVVLRQASVNLGKGQQKVLLPTTEATVEPGADPVRLPLQNGLSIQQPAAPIQVGQVFEVQHFGTPPRSAQRFRLCAEPPESLGNTRTPSLVALATQALSQQMPGMFYAPEMPAEIDQFIQPGNNFRSKVPWKLPNSVPVCVQPVERVNVAEAQCPGATCERPMSARYTLRVRKGADVLARPMAEAQFRSGSFYPQTDAAALVRLVEADLIDEAAPLLDKAAAQIRLTAP